MSEAGQIQVTELPVSQTGRGLPGGSAGKESACSVGDLGLVLGREDPPEKRQATHSSHLAWRITRDRAPGRPLQSMGSRSQTRMGN